MRFVARVTLADGQPLVRARVDIVAADTARAVAVIGRGSVRDGALTAQADPGPIWGVRIDGQPVVTVPVSITADLVDLGTIVWAPAGIEWPVFHATDGRVFGAPRAAQLEAIVAPPAALAAAATAALAGAAETAPQRSRMTFGDLFGSTARQLSTAAAAKSEFSIASATVTLKGVPSTTEDAISLEFPSAEVAATGVGLSELSFSIKPKGEAAAAQPAPTGPLAPDLRGYTRELATRKAAAAGYVAEVNNEIVADAANAGRVIRQLPAPGTELRSGGLIRLYIGKMGEA